jgi:hypothetical protein
VKGRGISYIAITQSADGTYDGWRILSGGLLHPWEETWRESGRWKRDGSGQPLAEVSAGRWAPVRLYLVRKYPNGWPTAVPFTDEDVGFHLEKQPLTLAWASRERQCEKRAASKHKAKW